MKYNKLKLIELIEKDKHSYNEIGLKVSMHSNMVGKIVRGESVPSIDSLPKFAAYYKKDMNYFFDIESVGIVSDPVSEYADTENPYKLLFEAQREINAIIKENADLKLECERLKNASAPAKDALAG